jgi:hypothetical protein
MRLPSESRLRYHQQIHLPPRLRLIQIPSHRIAQHTVLCVSPNRAWQSTTDLLEQNFEFFCSSTLHPSCTRCPNTHIARLYLSWTSRSKFRRLMWGLPLSTWASLKHRRQINFSWRRDASEPRHRK